MSRFAASAWKRRWKKIIIPPWRPNPPRLCYRFGDASGTMLGLVGLLCFLAVAACLHALLPDPMGLPAQYRSRKMALIEQWHAKANVAAFGSSRMHEGFLPETFDAQWQGMGFQPTSLNLGIVAGSLNEQRALAKRFLARTPKNCPVLAILEINAGLNLPPETRFDPRTVNLYDWESLTFVARFEDPNVGFARHMGRLIFALSATAAHYANAGMLSALLFPVEPTLDHTEDARGHIALPQTDEEKERVVALFAARPAAPEAKEVVLGNGYRQLLDNIAQPNARYLYVVAPMLEDMTIMPDYPASMDGPNGAVSILNLARPDRFPELYHPDMWRNATHMTHEGALVFSRLLGQEVARRGLITGCGG